MFPTIAQALTSRFTPKVATTSFINPSSTHKVWRAGTSYTGYIQLPTGYSHVAWSLVQHRTFTTVASGTNLTVTNTFSFLGVDQPNTYGLLYTATKAGKPDLWFLLPGEITCLPAIFTSGTADTSFDLATGSFAGMASNWTDFAATGKKLYVHGTYTGSGTPNFFYWLSSSATHPIHVIFHSCVVNGSSYLLKLGENHNFIIDGCDDETVPYGLVCNKTSGGINECVYITPADSSHDSINWIVGGIHVNNGSYLQGGTGFVTQMVNNATWNDSTTRFSNLTFFNLLIENTQNEGLYLGHTVEGSSPAFIKLSNVLLYRITTNHTGNEGLQIGGIVGGEMFKCQALDSGLTNTAGQNYNTQFSMANSGMTWYMNFGQTTLNQFQAFTGQTGGDTEMFANVWISTQGSGTNNNFWHNDNNSLHTSIYYGVGYNTWLLNTGRVFQMYDDATFGAPTSKLKMYTDGNVVVSDQATEFSYNSGFDSSQTIMHNLVYTSSATPQFANLALYNLRPSSLSSPMFGFTPNSTALAARVHPWFEYDFDGYKRNPANRCGGAFSGVPLMTL